jgi:hypothetical protein
VIPIKYLIYLLTMDVQWIVYGWFLPNA